MLLIFAISLLLLNIAQISEGTAMFSMSNSQQNAIITSGNISCIISNGELYVNGKHKGHLSTAQKEEFERYAKNMDVWGTHLYQSIQEEMETSMKRMMKIQKAISRIFDEDGFFTTHFSSFHSIFDEDDETTNKNATQHNKAIEKKKTITEKINKNESLMKYSSSNSIPNLPSFCIE